MHSSPEYNVVKETDKFLLYALKAAAIFDLNAKALN